MAASKNPDFINSHDEDSRMSVTSEHNSSVMHESDDSPSILDDKLEELDQRMIQDPSDSQSDDIIRRTSLEDECARRPFLDGTWFRPDLTKSSFAQGVFGICQLCPLDDPDKPHLIKGVVHSVSNFKSHIKTVHKKRLAEFEDYCAQKRQRLDHAGDRKEDRVTCHFDQTQLDDNIANFILDTFVPFNIVEAPSFKKMFTDLGIKSTKGKELRLLGCTTYKRRTDQAFKEKMSNIREEIEGVRYLCSTADVWTSRHRRFMGVTVSWLDPKTFKRTSYALACRRFPESHTHDRIATLLNDIHSQNGMSQEKLVGTVTDNASNFIKAFKEFGVNLDERLFYEDYLREFEEDENTERDTLEIVPFAEMSSRLLPTHQLCADHLLHLIATADVTRGINSVQNLKLMYDDVIKKCNKLWNLTRSPKKYETIVKFLGQALKRPVVTRWNSLFDAFKQLVGLQEKMLGLLEKLEVTDSLVASDFIFLAEYTRCTRPIADALDCLQGDVGYGFLLPSLISARNDLKDLQQEDLLYCKPLLTILLKNLESRFSNYFNVVEEGTRAAVAAATHPEFKLSWIQCLDEPAQGNVMSAIKTALVSCHQPRDLPEPCKIQMKMHKKFNFGPPEVSATVIQTNLDIIAIEREFERYCHDPKDELAILHAYPTVRATFLKFNTLLPSSASVERMFSFATMFDIAKFNRLSDANFEKRVLCKANSVLRMPSKRAMKEKRK